MLRHFHWLVLRKLPGPFFGWLGTLMFLLLMQFLIKWLPELAGKGLPLMVIVELVVYNLAYMMVLAVPMSVLLATLMAYGQLSESQAYAVIKSAGVSLIQLIWPTLVVGLLVMGGMLYFNNVVLPEANYRARNLWQDIRSKQPGFELRPGIFYNGLEGYSILVQDRPPESNTLIDVTVYQYSENGREQTLIKAKRGLLRSKYDGLQVELELQDGEMHRTLPPQPGSLQDRYERMTFDQHLLRLDLSDFAFQRSDKDGTTRSDRTTPTVDMVAYVDSMQRALQAKQQELRTLMQEVLHPAVDSTATLASDDRPAEQDVAAMPRPATAPDTTQAGLPVRHVALRGLDEQARFSTYNAAYHNARRIRSDVSNIQRNMAWKTRRINQYQVEIYKKFSIAIACLIFALIGAPLGLSIRRGSLGTVAAYALGIFLFYWVTLVQGEKLADRGLLPPWLGMWIANTVMLILGTWLVVYVTMDLRATPALRTRLWAWLQSRFE